MATDIKLSDSEVTVEGPLVIADAIQNGLRVKGRVGIGTDTPGRSLHVVGEEIHSGGTGGGFSFGDRAVGDTLVDGPSNGERYVWYANGGAARLWSGYDLLSIGHDGNAGFAAGLSVAGNASFAASLSVTGDVAAEANVAIAGKVQIDGELNVGPGQSGITIGEGKIWITTLTQMRLGGKLMPQIGRADLVEMVTDLKAEVSSLKKELEALQAKVG